ncbi:hypothetical protein SEA_NERGAL_1 [Mycobacterium Phage Nergal]|nr:hypothetical protein SEA_NERGAL_1 [Mycobacterium Phage Nergal]
MPYVKYTLAASMPSGAAAKLDLDGANFPPVSTTAGREAVRDALNRLVDQVTADGGFIGWVAVEHQTEETQPTGETVTRTNQVMSPVDGEYSSLFDVIAAVTE